jgi:Protein of unknown function (DUF1553)/Protein of unknown function (DUF1549)/Planctomycete cytochrome C
MICRQTLMFLAITAMVSSTVAVADEQQFSAEDIQYFERTIRPLLSEHCYSCHSTAAKTVHGGLRLDSAESVKQGGDSGPVVVAGKPAESLLVETIHYNGDIQMPPKGKLPDAVIETLTAWVQRGVPIPTSSNQTRAPDQQIDFEAGRTFWSFQPAHEMPQPSVEATHWPRNRIDYFTLAAMEREGLSPSPESSRATLIRRVTFDLIGLPPSPEQVAAFVNDDAPDAYERLVERLLESPQYGEKWARIWLDMARYTDRTASWLSQTAQAHLYRDWVVQAFNQDMPYDDFIHRQLATDLMSETGPDDLPALGFIGLSPTYWKELKLPCEIIKVIVADEWEERVDTVSRTFLGLTVACARCHDHKFDPISSEDYYALAGVFASCRQIDRPLIPEQEYAPVRLAKQEVAKLEAELKKLRKQKPNPDAKAEHDQAIAELVGQIKNIKTTTPLYETPLANAISEESMYVERAGKTPQDGTRLVYRPGPQDLPLFARGNPNRPGDPVPRRFLTVLTNQSLPFENGSGRLELAQAITTDAVHLAARVIVNRIWLAHFGQGIVNTPSNFGEQGGRPTHPALLDDLAARFIAKGWSIKNLHREILLSATWQQSSEFDQQKTNADPDNRWLSRMNRHRLDFEAWRDSMLATSGELDLTLGGPSLKLSESTNHRRTLYATVHRRDMSTTLQIHDFPDPTQHSPQRSSTITALQGLYTLNAPLLAEQSRALVARLHDEIPDDDQARIVRAYNLLFSRSPTDKEQQLAMEYLGNGASDLQQARWQQYAHVLLASNEFLFVD